MIYRTRPLSAAARTRLHDITPVSSPFRSSWSSTEILLEHEIWELGADEFVMQIDVEERHLRVDGSVRADARPASASVAISFEARTGPLEFVCGTFTTWQDNVRAIALGLEALRKVDRYGITRAAEQYRGFGALPPGMPMPAAQLTVEEAARLLWNHAGMSAPFDLAQARSDAQKLYRWAAKNHHPDVPGGDPALFRRLAEARDLLAGATS